MRVLSTSPARVERLIPRCLLAIAALSLQLALAGCASTEAFDAPFADYQQRTILVATTGGDAMAANTALQTATPWPRYANNTNIPADGARMAKVIQRYESGAAGDSGGQAPSYAGAGGTNGASAGILSSPSVAAPAQQ
jgi:type IV pilus biogenesis protein CpaD/CtpE